MSATVDERIVAAKFDASDFEKGVNKTIKKLDELKKSLNMKDTTKSVNELSEKVKTSTDSMSGSLEKLTNRLTTFTGMIKQNILSGLAQEVSDVFLKMERAVTGFIRSLGSEQISVGMQKYEQMLTSVRTMIASGVSQDSAYDAIEDLRNYSDQTSYSLSQMTDALSKFKAAGVDLKEATKSVQGIANACAVAGINATDAGRAFYNLSQAYSSGTLKYTDYRSLELLNMTTEKFKQNLLEAAEEAGTLKKLSDGTYKTIKHQGDKITAGKKVTIKNIQDALRYGFVTKDVMNKLFGGKYYFSEKEFAEYKSKYTDKYGNITEAGREKAIADAKKDFNEFAVDAYLAAREARNFTDVMNTLKDVVSTGWSTTFENLFGKLEEATKFFTKLAEGGLADSIYKIGEYRNAILGFWNGLGTDYEGTGAQMIQDTILNITDALGTLFKTFQQVLPGFDELDKENQPTLQALGKKLRNFTAEVAATSLRIKEAMEAFNDWMNSPIFEGGPTRIETIRKTIANLMSVFSIAYKVFSIGFNAIIKLATAASPIFDALSLAFEKMTEPLVDLKNNSKPFEDMEHSANNIIIALQPIIDGLSAILGIAGEIGKFFVGMAIDTVTMNLEFFSDVLRFFIDLFTDGKSSQSLKDGESILDKIRKALEGIKEACSNGLSAVKEFLGSLIKDLRVLFGITDENEEKIQNGGFFENLAKFFETNEFVQSAKAWIDQVILDVTNWIKDIPNKIHALGANIYNTLYGLFFKDETKYNGSQLETKTVLTPLGEWMDKAIKEIVNFFVTLPDKIIKGVGDVFNWINEVFDYLFGKRTIKTIDKSNSKTRGQEVEVEIWSRFDEFFVETKNSIRDWFNDLPNKVRKAFTSIGDFATKLINTIDEFLFGRKVTYTKRSRNEYGGMNFKRVVVRYKSGFSKWLDNLIKEVKKFIAKIPEYIKEGIKGAGDIISSIVGALFGTEDQSTSQDASKKVEEGIKKPFLGINWINIWNTIKDIGTTLLNQIARIFTGTDNVEYNANWFAEKVAEGIRWISDKADEAFKWVLDNFPKIPEKIAELFTGEGKTTEEQDKGPVGQSISGFVASIGKFIENIPTMLLQTIQGIASAIDEVWSTFYNMILNPVDESSEKIMLDSDGNVIGTPKEDMLDTTKQENAWTKFINELGQTIQSVVEKLPTWIVQGLDVAFKLIGDAFDSITDWFKNVTISDAAAELAENVSEETKNIGDTVAEATEEGTKESDTGHSLFESIKNLGLRIYKLFTEHLPPFFSAAWEALKGGAGGIWDGIKNIFNGVPEEGWQKSVSDFGTKIKEFIKTELPTKISEGWIAVTNFIKELFAPKKDKYFVDMSHMTDAEKAYYSRYIEDLQKPFKNAEKELKNQNGVGSFFETFKQSFLDGLEIIGPIILNGISTALNWLGKVATVLMNVLTGNTSLGDEIEKVYGKEKPELKQALANIGESIKTFLLETLPKFIGVAIGEISKYASEAFKNLTLGINEGITDGIDETAKSADDSLKGSSLDPENSKGFFAKLLDIFKTIGQVAAGGTAEAIVMVFALAYFLKQLKQALSLTDELDAMAGTLKWGAILVAILGISSILSSIMDIVKNGTPEQIDAAEKILDKLGGLLEKVAWIVGLMSVGKIANAIGDLFGGTNIKVKAGKGANVNIEGLGETIGGLSGTLFNGLKTGLGLTATGAGIYGFSKLITKAVDETMDSLMMIFDDFMVSLDGIMDVINPFVTKLTETGNNIDKAIDAVVKIKDLYVNMFSVFDSLYEEVGGKEIKDLNNVNAAAGFVTNDRSGNMKNSKAEWATAMKAFLSDFSVIMDTYISLTTFIDSLADALNKMKDVESIDSGIKTLTGLLTSPEFNGLVNLIFSNLYSLFKRFAGDGIGTEAAYSISMAFSTLASVMDIITTSLNGLDSESATSFTQAMDLISKISEVFDGETKNIAVLGNRMQLFGGHMKRFYGYVKDIEGFNAEDVDATNAKIASMVSIIKGASDSVENLSKHGEGLKFLPDLGSYLPDLGSDFASFMSSLDTALPKDINDGRLEALSSATSGIAALLSSFGNLGYLSKFSGVNFETYEAVIDDIYTHIMALINNPENNKFGSVVLGLYRIITDPLTTQDAYDGYRETGESIAGELYKAIQAALDDPTNDYHPKITPIISDDALSNVRKYFLNSGITPQFNTDASFSFNAQTDEKLNKIQQTLDSIDGRLDTMNKNSASVGDFTSALSGLQIVANTGALVGVMTPAIDKAIGDRVWLLTRRNSLGA